MIVLKNTKKKWLTRVAYIGVLTLASMVAFIGCDNASPGSGSAGPGDNNIKSGDTTPPRTLTIPSLNAGNETITFEAINPNDRAVKVTIAVQLTAPPQSTIEVTSIVVDGAQVQGNSVDLTGKGTDDASKNIQITGLANGAAYTVTLTIAIADNPDISQQQTVTTIATPLAPPNAPTGLVIVPKNGMVDLTWKVPEVSEDNPTVSGYNIYRVEGNDAPFGSEPLATARTLEYTDRNNVENGKTYRYSIRAVNANGSESGESNTVVKAAHFYLHTNGITIICTGASDGAVSGVMRVPGVVTDTTYTKRAKGAITQANAATTCTSGITDMSALFKSAGAAGNTENFNADIRHWDTSSVTDMSGMFTHAKNFNREIGVWNVENVENMSGMFESTSFDQDISGWDVSSVTNMSTMFLETTSFDQDIGDWEVGNVENMRGMFKTAAAFNQNIGKWDVRKITDRTRMEYMFDNVDRFNQNISTWCVTNINPEPNAFYTSKFSSSNTDYRPPVWGTCPSS